VMKKLAGTIISVILLLVADQCTKYLAVQHLKDQNPVVLIKYTLELHYLENRGAAFGSLQGRQVLLLIITAIVLIGLIVVYLKMPSNRRFLPLRMTVILLFSGAVGNMIDRIMNHYVVDFIYFKVINFPIFNVADCYVTIAAVLLAVLILFVYEEEELQFWSRSK
jgi:signal peptidase II